MSILSDAFRLVKSIDLDKVKSGVDLAKTGAEMASAAFEKPEVALAALLKTFARRAMDTDLGEDGAKDLARVVITRIRNGKRAPR